jgi:hypothetical protein
MIHPPAIWTQSVPRPQLNQLVSRHSASAKDDQISESALPSGGSLASQGGSPVSRTSPPSLSKPSMSDDRNEIFGGIAQARDSMKRRSNYPLPSGHGFVAPIVQGLLQSVIGLLPSDLGNVLHSLRRLFALTTGFGDRFPDIVQSRRCCWVTGAVSR